MRKILFTLLLAVPFIAAAQTTAPMGILVSQTQGTIDWPKVVEENDLDYAFIMASVGATIIDSRCGINMEQAHKVAMPIGCVHRYDRHYSAQGQFDNFKAAVKGFHMDLAPAVCVFSDGPYDLNVKRIDALLALFESEYGVKPLIMTTVDTYYKLFNLERYASYHVIIVNEGLKFPVTRYTCWQYTSKEKVAGIMEYVPGLKLHPTYSLNNIKLK